MARSPKRGAGKSSRRKSASKPKPTFAQAPPSAVFDPSQYRRERGTARGYIHKVTGERLTRRAFDARKAAADLIQRVTGERLARQQRAVHQFWNLVRDKARKTGATTSKGRPALKATAKRTKPRKRKKVTLREVDFEDEDEFELSVGDVNEILKAYGREQTRRRANGETRLTIGDPLHDQAVLALEAIGRREPEWRETIPIGESPKGAPAAAPWFTMVRH